MAMAPEVDEFQWSTSAHRRREDEGPEGELDPSAEGRDPRSESTKLSLLVIEDEEGDRFLLRQTLRRHAAVDVEITEAETVADGLANLRTRPFHCALLDLHLPDGGGIDLLRQLNQEGISHTPVVVLTGMDIDALALDCLKAGAEDCLMKGDVSSQGILRSVHYAMERHRVRARLADDNARLAKMSHHDSLTGLLNRRGLEVWLEKEADREDAPLRMAVLVDMDDFKTINDSFGYETGDEVLRVVGAVLRTTTRREDKAARVGGDEFVAILDTTDMDEAVQLAERIREEIVRRLRTVPALAAQSYHASASLGVAPVPGDTRTATSVLARCTDAIHESKASGKNRVAVAKMGDAPLAPMSLNHRLDLALTGQYHPDRNPIVDLQTGAVLAWEYRVRPPDGFPGSTSDLLRLATEQGVLEQVDARTIAARLAWFRRDPTPGAIYLPVSAPSLRATEVVASLRSFVEDLPAGTQLMLQLHARQIGELDGALEPAVRVLRDLGIGFILADVGHGQTSIELLLAIRPEILRLDRSLVESAVTVPQAGGPLRMLLDIAGAVGASVIAEGIDTPTASQRVQQAGIRVGAGPAASPTTT